MCSKVNINPLIKRICPFKNHAFGIEKDCCCSISSQNSKLFFNSDEVDGDNNTIVSLSEGGTIQKVVYGEDVIIEFVQPFGNIYAVQRTVSPSSTSTRTLHTFNPETYETINSIPMIINDPPGLYVSDGLGISYNQANDKFYVIVTVRPGTFSSIDLTAGQFILGTIDVDTGIVDIIGYFSDKVVSMTFTDTGTLYVITAHEEEKYSGIPSTLYTVDLNNANTTFVKDLSPSINNPTDFGEVIAFNPQDGLIYRWTFNNTNLFYQSINITDLTVTNITLSGDSIIDDITGAVYLQSNKFLLRGQGNTRVYECTTAGVVTKFTITSTTFNYLQGFGLKYTFGNPPPLPPPPSLPSPQPSQTHIPSGNIFGLARFTNLLLEINPSTFAITSNPITIAGSTITNGIGLTYNLSDEKFYAIVELDTTSDRCLVTIDVNTQIATFIGPILTFPSGITSTPEGKLYIITDSGNNTIPEFIYEINPTDATTTFFMNAQIDTNTTSNQGFGEALAYNSENRKMYRWSGKPLSSPRKFMDIDLISRKITYVTSSNSGSYSIVGAVYTSSGKLLTTTNQNRFIEYDTIGNEVDKGSTAPFVIRGMAQIYTLI